jgi:DNA-binding CsgD family transcriptional regulator/tetratricopeptide (TPR) repeat protein
VTARRARTPFVFLSYRREDTSGYAGRLHDALSARFGDGAAFMDVETIPPGADFARHVDDAMARCRAVLVLIGPRWLTAATSGGQRRLDAPDDYLRLEVEAGLRGDALVIPVLVQGAQMPRPDELPEPMRPLAARNAVELSDTRWQADVRRLGDVLAPLQRSTRRGGGAPRDGLRAVVATPATDAVAPLEPTTRLVGRDVELERIAGALADAADGTPRLLIVVGEAGIGKTGLTIAAAATARSRGGQVLSGACLDIGEGGLPYLPIAQALRGLARETAPDALDELLGDGRDELALLAPALGGDESSGGHRRDAAIGVAVPSGSSQARLFERFMGLLDRVGLHGPCLLIVEDVQWVDRATRDLLTFLVRNITTERVAIMLTCRPDDLPKSHPVLTWLAELERSRGAERLAIGRLDRAGVGQMLANLLGASADEAVAARVWRRSGGNPLFVEELLAAELERTATASARPASLEASLVARVAGLSAGARRVVDVLSVGVRPLDEDAVTVLLAQDHVAPQALLQEAIDHGVLEPEPGGEGYRFRHELTREVVERDLMATERRSFHQRFAELLRARPDLAGRSPADAAAELASHWLSAGRTAEAYQASIAASEAAEAVHAFAEALAHLERALELESGLPADVAPTPADAFLLRRRAADLADVSGQFARSMELNREALDLADALGDAASAGVIHGRLGYLEWITGDLAAAISEHEAAVRLVPATPPSVERAHVLGGLGGVLMAAGRWAESRALCEAAIACAAEVGSRAEESRARNMLGSDLVSLGETDAGIEQLRRSRELAEGSGPPDLLILAHHNLAINLIQADRVADALAEAQAGRVAARAAGLERRFGQDLAALVADALLRLGRWDDADAATLEGLALAQSGSETIYLAAIRARLAALRGDAAEAALRLAGIDGLTLDPDVASLVGSVRAEAALADGRPADAATAVADGLARLEGLDDVIWAAPLVALGLQAAADEAAAGDAAVDLDCRAPAQQTAAGLMTRVTWLSARATTTSSRAWVALAQAQATRFAGPPEPAAWATVRDLWAALGDPFEAAYARVRLAEAVVLAGGGQDVHLELEAAVRTAQALGAGPLRRQAEAVASVAGITLEVQPEQAASPVANNEGPIAALPTTGHSVALSAPEMELLGLIADGLSNRQIADRLALTRKAVNIRVSRILRVLDVSTRAEATMAAERLGIAARSQSGP